MYINLYGIIGFGLTAGFAVAGKWTLPEFCWSTWLTGLVYARACAFFAPLQIILTARSKKPAYDARLPFIQQLSPMVFLFGAAMLGLTLGLLAFYLYGLVFGFYGLFLSVFSEMEPLALFGRNGFINSDFYTPLTHLLILFWPMALGALIANWQDFVYTKNPWKQFLLPFHKEVLHLHVFILALPFITMIAWALFGKAYQSITIVALIAVFYLLPGKKPGKIEPPQDGPPRP